MKTPPWKIRVYVLLAALVPAVAATSATAACDDPRLETLMTLVGEWRVTLDGERIGELAAAPAAEGCALLETWRSADGTRSVSLHWLDAASGELRQVYVDSAGWFIEVTGGVENGILEYQGKAMNEAGEEYLRRATLHGLGTDEVVQIDDVSDDDGATWQRLATTYYTRIKESD